MTRLYDNMFPNQFAVHGSGGMHGAKPERVVWRREGDPGANAWFTDSSLREAERIADQFPRTRRIAWLLEPPDLRTDAYDFVLQSPGLFHEVFTHCADYWPKARWVNTYLFGGTRIGQMDRGLDYRKRADASIVVSEKRSMKGHQMRHELLSMMEHRDGMLSVFGPGLIDKTVALAAFRFHVAIENCRRDYWFTEAIIDPMLMGAVPIYWGCPSIGQFFNPAGIIQCETLDEVERAVLRVNGTLYEEMLPAIRDNYERALGYVCTEDWLYRATSGAYFDED